MNPESNNESYIKALRAKYGAKKITTEDEATRVNNLYDARRNMLRDSERDDAHLGQEFHEENNWADLSKDLDKNLSSLSEYQVDPMDMDEYGEKSDYEYWAEDDEKEAILMRTPSNYLSEDELHEKVDLYINDPLEHREPLPPPPPSPSGLMDYNAMASEVAGPPKPTPPASKTGPASKNNPYGVPNATFYHEGYRHDWFMDGRRVKTKIEKPGTGVTPANHLKPGAN